MTRRSLIGLLALVALLSGGSPITAQETVDPQSLVGKWEGQGNRLTFGATELTVTGNKMDGVWRGPSSRWALELFKK
jgi:hypothetical protein